LHAGVYDGLRGPGVKTHGGSVNTMSIITQSQPSSRDIWIDPERLEALLRDVDRREMLELIRDVASVNGRFDKALLGRFHASRIYEVLDRHQKNKVDNIVNGAPRKPLQPYLLEVVRALITVGNYDMAWPSYSTGWNGLRLCVEEMLDPQTPRRRNRGRRR
jgi:hypothetical protein